LEYKTESKEADRKKEMKTEKWLRNVIHIKWKPSKKKKKKKKNEKRRKQKKS
jgi:hypothetical protein